MKIQFVRGSGGGRQFFSGLDGRSALTSRPHGSNFGEGGRGKVRVVSKEVAVLKGGERRVASPGGHNEARSGLSSRSGVKSGLSSGGGAQTFKDARWPGRARDGRSFAEVVAGSAPSGRANNAVFQNKVNEIQRETRDGCPVVRFSHLDIRKGAWKFRFALVLKFIHGKPLVKDLHNLITSVWRINGRYSFSEAWDSSHVLVVLDSEADKRKCLSSQVRFVASKEFKIFKWRLDYKPGGVQKLHHVWVRFHGLPVFLFDKILVRKIVSGFGKLIKLDNKSELLRDLSCLKACVEVKGDTYIPEMVFIHLPDNKGYWQDIQVEKSVCSKCRVLGHLDRSCPLKVWVRKMHQLCKREHHNGRIGDAECDVGAVKNVQIDMEIPSEQGVEAGWQVVSRSKEKRGAMLPGCSGNLVDIVLVGTNENELELCHDAGLEGAAVEGQFVPPSNATATASPKDTVVGVGNEGDVFHNNATPILPPSNISAEVLEATDGNLNVAKERSKSLAKVDNRSAVPSNGDHASLDVGQCARLGLPFTCEKHDKSQIMLAMTKESNKNKIVPRCNKRSSGSFEALEGHNKSSGPFVTLEGHGICDMQGSHVTSCMSPSMELFEANYEKGSDGVEVSNADKKIEGDLVGNSAHPAPDSRKREVAQKSKHKRVMSYPKESCHFLGKDEKDLFDEFDKVKSLMNGDGVGSIYISHVEDTCDKLVGSNPITHVEDSIEKVVGSTSHFPTNHVNASLSFVGSTSNEAKASMAWKKCGSLGSRGLHSSIPSIHPNVAALNKGARSDPATPVFSNSASQAGPCDSLELVRKKMGCHKLIYEKEALVLNKDMKEGSNRPAEKDSPSGDSDSSIDLFRILKQPRRKSNGSRKKKGSNVVY